MQMGRIARSLASCPISHSLYANVLVARQAISRPTVRLLPFLFSFFFSTLALFPTVSSRFSGLSSLASSLPAVCLSVCLPVWVLSVLHLIFICFYFSLFPSNANIFLCCGELFSVRWKRKIKNAIAIKIA